MKRTPLAVTRPVLTLVLLELAVILVYLVAGAATQMLALSTIQFILAANLALSLLAAALLLRWRWWGEVGFRPARRPRDLLLFAPLLIPVLVNLLPGVALPAAGELLAILLATLAVGFAEEVIFRGLMLRALQARGAWQAALVTALLFGVTHALNVLSGKSAADAAAQIFYALALGLAYAALALRSGLLGPLVLIHFATDAAFFVQKPGFEFPAGVELAIVLGIAALFTAYGLILLARRPRAPEGRPA